MQDAINPVIGNTILRQLGGGKFIAMTGAKNIGLEKDGVVFKIMRVSGSRITHVRVTLLPSDTYKMTFLNIRGFNPAKTVAEVEGIYSDQLQETFTRHTGLYTSL